MSVLKPIALSLALAGLGVSAFAQETCFERTYSAAHLAANPDQVVTRLSIRFADRAKSSTSAGNWIFVNATYKNDPLDYAQGAECRNNGPDHLCAVECDGGQMRIRWQSPDKITAKADYFLMSSDCGEGSMRELADDGTYTTTFALTRADISACPALPE